jgi:hypothetical protein
MTERRKKPVTTPASAPTNNAVVRENGDVEKDIEKDIEKHDESDNTNGDIAPVGETSKAAAV